MNGKFDSRVLLCLATMIMSCLPEAKAECVNSGFGIGLTLGMQRNAVDFSADNLNKLVKDTNATLTNKLKEAIANTTQKFATPITKDTKMVDSDETYNLIVYENNAGNIKGATDATKLSTENKTIQLKLKKFEGDNPTKYRIVDSSNEQHGKYDANGMCNNANGKPIKEAIKVNKDIFANNACTAMSAPTNNPPETDTTDIGNYASFQKNGTDYFCTPKDYFILDNMNKDLVDENTVPTHVLLSDLSGDKTTYSFLQDVLGNSTTLESYKKQFTGENDFFQDPNDKKIYINTVKYKDLGLSDTFLSGSNGGAINTLSPDTSSSQIFKPSSKWSFDIGAMVFYQYRIYDWFIRAGIFVNFPTANKKVSIIESENKEDNNDKKKKASDNDFSLEHSFDVGAQILGGYNISQNLSAVFGVEFGYSKWKLNNLDKLTSKYALADSKLAKWVLASDNKALDSYNQSIKDMGLSDKEKKIGKWFWRGVLGLEYNFNNFIIGLQGFFGPSIKLMKKSNKNDLGDVKVSNAGVRLNLAYKF